MRKLPAAVFAGVPCATCPPHMGVDLNYDGALIGAGCQPYSGRGHAADVARARRGTPSDVTAVPRASGPQGTGGTRPRSRADVDRASNIPSPAEIRDAFEHPVLPDGSCCARLLKADQQEGRPPRTVVYVNGIRTGLQAHCCSLRKIASTTCARVVGVFNAPAGGTGAEDVWQARGDIAAARATAAGQDRGDDVGRNPALDAMQALVEEKGRTGEPLEIWAHSQGGATLSAALSRARRTLQRQPVPVAPLSNLTVNSFGSAAVVWPDGPTYTHYIHEGDPVAAHLTGSGFTNWAKRRGLGDAGLGLGPFGERVAGRGATVVFADGPVPSADTAAGAYRITEHQLPDPAWRCPLAPGEFMSIDYHLFDSSYLPLYRQRARAVGRRDGCSPPTYPYGDPCGPAKPPRVAAAPAAAQAPRAASATTGAASRAARGAGAAGP